MCKCCMKSHTTRKWSTKINLTLSNNQITFFPRVPAHCINGALMREKDAWSCSPWGNLTLIQDIFPDSCNANSRKLYDQEIHVIHISGMNCYELLFLTESVLWFGCLSDEWLEILPVSSRGLDSPEPNMSATVWSVCPEICIQTFLGARGWILTMSVILWLFLKGRQLVTSPIPQQPLDDLHVI